MMTRKIYVKSILVTALIALALGGFLLHLRIHSVADNRSNVVPLIAGILSILVVPLLFAYKKTVQYGFVLNGMLAIIGTIVMAHFSFAHWPTPSTAVSIVTKTLLADILILWALFFVGKALFELETFGYDPDKPKRGVIYRYPNLGWWFVHLIGISLVYTLGHQLWR
jgi:hypothetical protein